MSEVIASHSSAAIRETRPLGCFASLVGELPATSAVSGELRCSARWQGQNECRSALLFVLTSSASESLGCRVGRVERVERREDSEGWLPFLAVPRAWALFRGAACIR